MKTRKKSRSLTDLVPQPSLKQSKIEDFVLTRLSLPVIVILRWLRVSPRELRTKAHQKNPNQSLNEPTLTELLAQQCFLVAETTASIQFQLDKIISTLNYLVSWATSGCPGLTTRQPDMAAGSSLPSLSKSTGQCNLTNSSNSTPLDANSHLVLQSKQVALNINPINGNLPHWGSIQLARERISVKILRILPRRVFKDMSIKPLLSNQQLQVTSYQEASLDLISWEEMAPKEVTPAQGTQGSLVNKPQASASGIPSIYETDLSQDNFGTWRRYSS
ncbi:hypothetical protein E2320_008050 [Naja naja]|nr:hypothetical protein E2320_008050 [Naja naja]